MPKRSTFIRAANKSFRTGCAPVDFFTTFAIVFQSAFLCSSSNAGNAFGKRDSITVIKTTENEI
ncbi:MAG: hypothetical protein LBC49_04000 [Bacteroidales bacterium]|nr:hypothetical protein [Bacteroidales bacterium]